MCTPILGLVMSVAKSVVSFAAAQDDYNNKAAQWKQNVTNSLASGRDEQQQLSLRMLQEQDSKSQKDTANIVEGAEIQAEAEVSADTAGISGISLDNTLLGIQRKIALKKAADDANHNNTVAQLTTEMKATNSTIKNRINSVQRPTAPNPLGFILQGVGGGLNALA